MLFLLGIHGKARSGKDLAAKYLVENHGFTRNAFADPLKRAVQQMFMLTEEQTWSDELKEVPIPYWDNKSPRELFQKLGTEGGRLLFGEDIWLKRWRYHYDAYKDVMNYVVPDVRFENEAEYIRSLGGVVIHVVRDGVESKLLGTSGKHASEAGIKPHANDFVLDNNGTKQDLYDRLNNVVASLPDWEKSRVE